MGIKSIGVNEDLNNITSSGLYYVTGAGSNRPSGINTTATYFMEVTAYNTDYTQKFYSNTNINLVYYRLRHTGTGQWDEWSEKEFIDNVECADYVVEQNILSASTSNSWNWRKWNSGVSECWGRWNESGTASSLSGTSFYYLLGAKKTLPTDLFLPLPIAFCQAALSVYGLASLTNPSLTATTIQPTYILGSNNGGQTIIGYVYIYLTGRWK